jgi:dTDP-4-amino-4,6-dideoxygalactose transaminase
MAGTSPLVSIPFAASDFTDLEIKAVTNALNGDLKSPGLECTRFEEDFRSSINRKHAICVSSGTAAIHLCIRASSIKSGDIVITNPYSDSAAISAILAENAIPVFVDIDERTGLMDLEQLKQAVHDLSSSNKVARRWLPRKGAEHIRRLKAIIPSAPFGQSYEMDAINDISSSREITIIEDLRQTFVVKVNDKFAGTSGNYGVISFRFGNPISTGGGGMIVTDDHSAAHFIRILLNKGSDPQHQHRLYLASGYDYRMNEMVAALARAQLSRIESILYSRQKVARWYNERLADRPGIVLPVQVEGQGQQSWPAYVIKLDPKMHRQRIIEELVIQGIPTTPYQVAVHLQPFMIEKFSYHSGDFPEAEQLAKRVLALPFSGVMTEKQVDYVCKTIKQTVS